MRTEAKQRQKVRITSKQLEENSMNENNIFTIIIDRMCVSVFYPHIITLAVFRIKKTENVVLHERIIEHVIFIVILSRANGT